jgi:predicted phosphodiesterase
MRPKRWFPCVVLYGVLLYGVLLAAAPPAHFRFAILGDRTGEAVPGVYEAAWQAIGRFHPAFVVNVGDTIQGGHDAGAAAEWRALRPLWNGVPMFLVPGNHDIWSAASERVWREQAGHPPFYSFSYGKLHVTVLDNSRSADISEAQYRFLEADLAANAAQRPKLIFMHRPSWLIPVLLRSSDFELQRLARKYGVNAVISGHIHQLSQYRLDGVLYLEVGSSGGHIDRGLNAGQGFEQGWFFQWLSAEVDGEHVAFTIHELGEPFGKGQSIPLEKWGQSRAAK